MELEKALADVVGPRHVLSDPELRASYERDYTGRYGASRSFYNPYTNRYGTVQGAYNPYTGRYGYHYSYGYR